MSFFDLGYQVLELRAGAHRKAEGHGDQVQDPFVYSVQEYHRGEPLQIPGPASLSQRLVEQGPDRQQVAG
jgi:hypothetical protein